MKSLISALLTASLAFATASAQVSTGTPLFSTAGGGPIDAINLGNLNVHLTIPVLNKAGRGVPFFYNLTYDSSIWIPVTAFGTTQWTPATNWGWGSDTAASLGYLSAHLTVTQVTGPPCSYYMTYVYSNYAYHDRFGRSHPFPGSTGEEYYPCNPPSQRYQFMPGFTTNANDGSGFTVHVSSDNNFPGDSVTSGSGTVVSGLPFQTEKGGATYTDQNGNQETVNTSGQFFDTLSSTTPVLAISGNGTPSSPTEFTYTAPNAQPASYTMSYTQYTVATNFGYASNPQIEEYGPTSVALVSSISLPDGTAYTFKYEQTPGSCTPLSGTFPDYCVTGRMVEVTLPTGGTITYSYSGGPNGTGIFSDGSSGSLQRTLSPGGIWNYTRSNVTGTPGPGAKWTTTTEDPEGNYTVSNFSEDSSTSPATYNLYETQRQIYQGSESPSDLLETLLMCYNSNYTNCSSASVSSPIQRVSTYTELANGLTRLSDVNYNGSFTGSGLESSDDEYDFGVSPGGVPGLSHQIRYTAIQYANLGNGIIGRPSSIVVTDWSSGSGVKISSTSYTYDQNTVTTTSGTPQHVSVTGSRGNLTTVAYEANSSTTLYQTYTYYDTGNLNTSTGFSASSSSPGPTTTYNYGSNSCGNSFVTSISEPLGLSRSMNWNCTGGVELSATDENNQTVSEAYNDAYFWRPAVLYDQENNPINITYSGQTASEGELVFNGGNSVADQRSTLDGFGRPILSQRLQVPNGSSYDTNETDYNAIGFADKLTMPFSASAGGTDSSAPGLGITYDALGRPLTITDSTGGTTSYTYSNNDVLVTVSGSQTFKKQLEYDGLGRLSSVCEISTTLPGVGTCGQSTTQSGYWTKYTYDALGHLLAVTQNTQASSGQQTRSYSYDMLGRTTSEANPESGTVNYIYDTACTTTPASPGDLTTRVDNAGNKTCYYYDALHRLNGGGWNTVCRRFNYDNSVTAPTGVTVANTKARLLEAETDNCSGTQITDEWFSYSARGELTDVYESTPHSSGYYHTTVSYWPSSSLETVSGIPSVPELYYGASNNSGVGLDGEGRYTQVTAGSGSNPVTRVTYSTTASPNPLDALTGVTYGSSDSDSFGYDPNSGRPTSYVFDVNGETDTGSLNWNSNGTLGSLGITDNISGTNDSESCSFTYDDLARIGGQDANGYSADCGSKWQQLFSYDAFGNVEKSGSSSFDANYSPSTNQFTIDGANVRYDGDGNLLADNLNSYTWDPNWGDMTSVNTGSTTVTATYDALGRAVELQSGSMYSEILYSPIGKVAIMNGSTLAEAFMPLPGGGTAVYGSSGLTYYRHADWLGSSRLASTQSRGLYSSTAYAPFGEQYATSGTADPSFTGQNSDTVSSLYDFTFRRLSPSQGRWISPDSAGLSAVDLTNPQSFNRYSYVADQPLSSFDPLGLAIAYVDGCYYNITYFYVDGQYDSEEWDLMYCYSSGGGAGAGGGAGGGGGGGSAPNNLALAPSKFTKFMNCVANGANNASLAALLPQNAPSLLKNLAGNDFASLQQLVLGPDRSGAAVSVLEGKGTNAAAQGILARFGQRWSREEFQLSFFAVVNFVAVKAPESRKIQQDSALAC
jgi:RHS repeat-associated protein